MSRGTLSRCAGVLTGRAAAVTDRPAAPLETLTYLRGRVHTSDPGAWYLERDRTLAALRAFARAHGLLLVGSHEDNPSTGIRRPGLAALVRAVGNRRVGAVLIPDGRHLSVNPDARAAYTALITDLGAQLITAHHPTDDTPDVDPGAPHR